MQVGIDSFATAFVSDATKLAGNASESLRLLTERIIHADQVGLDVFGIYRDAGRRAGHSPEELRVGVHALGFVAETTGQAVENFFPGYAQAFTKVGKERGWPPVTRRQFDKLIDRNGALLVGNSEEIAVKILEHSAALGGISRISFQMDVAALPHAKLMNSIELIGGRVAPVLRATTHSPTGVIENFK